MGAAQCSLSSLPCVEAEFVESGDGQFRSLLEDNICGRPKPNPVVRNNPVVDLLMYLHFPRRWLFAECL